MNQEHHRLTPGEEAVLALMARAKPIGDIAAELGLPVEQVQRLANGALESSRRIDPITTTPSRASTNGT